MKLPFKKNEKLDIEKINSSVSLLNKILKILFILLIVGVVFLGTLIFKEWHIIPFVKTILAVCAPLFIGFVIAWLFNPIVSGLQKLGVKRVLGTILVYSVIILVIVIFFWALIPMIVNEFNDLVSIIPNILNTVKDSAISILDNFDEIKGLDLSTVKTNLLDTVETFATDITINLPNTFFSIVSSFFSGASVFLISMIVGFYMLLNFDSTTKHFLSLLPKKYRSDADELITEISTQLFKYVKGVFIIATGIFIICSIGFYIVGLKAPLLFGLFCGITNIIPYVGPYLGGAPAVIVGFTQSPLTGILALVIVAVVQVIEGNVLQPVIMSKTMKLHPVSIIVGLIVFGKLFGITGMVLATPIISLGKILYKYISKKVEEKKKNKLLISE